MHSYLRGTCIEVMANSDNVLRGGLTGKHIDVDALLHVVDFSPAGDVLLPSGSDGTYIYPTSFEEFELWLLQPTDGDTLQIPRGDSGRICLVASGSFELTGDGDPVVLKPGTPLSWLPRRRSWRGVRGSCSWPRRASEPVPPPRLGHFVSSGHNCAHLPP